MLPCLFYSETTRKVTFKDSIGFPKEIVIFVDGKETAKESISDTGAIARTGSSPDGMVKEYFDSKKLA